MPWPPASTPVASPAGLPSLCPRMMEAAILPRKPRPKAWAPITSGCSSRTMWSRAPSIRRSRRSWTRFPAPEWT